MSEEEKLFEQLVTIVEKLGWTIALPNVENDEDPLPGLIVGENWYVQKVLNGDYVDFH